MEARTAQVRIMRRVIIAEGSGERRCPINCGAEKCSHGGPVVYVTPSRAKMLIDAGAVELVNAGPSEIKPSGPSEKKDKAPSEGGKGGPSTASAPSTESGKAEPSSASVAVPASPVSKSNSSKKRGRPKGSKAS